MDPLGSLRVPVHVHDDRDRAVEAGAEALREQVVGPAARLVERLCPLVGCTQPDEGRGRQRGSRTSNSTTGNTILACEVTNRPQRATRVFSRPSSESSTRRKNGTFQPIDLVAEERQHGEEERVRDQHGRQDAKSAADPELRDEVEADEGQAADRDGDRETGEEHGSPGGGAGFRRGVARRQPFMEELSEARHDEQRVVDPHPEPDHRHQDRSDRVDRRQAGEDEQEEERRHQRHDREHDRDQHRDERAEDDQEHDDRGEQPESLGDSLLERRELGLAVVLDGDARRLDRLTHGILHRHHLIRSLSSIVWSNCASA